MIKYEELNNLQLDTLKEVGNIGAGHAATALSQILLEKVQMTVPAVSIISLTRACEVLGGVEQPVVGVYMRVFGDAPGKIVFLFTQAEALTLIDNVAGVKHDSLQNFGEYETSAMKEIGNIMTGAYLYALANLTGLNYFSSVPAFAHDMAGAILNTVLLDLGLMGDYALLIETQFSLSITQRKLNGHFFLIPDPDSLGLILDALLAPTRDKK
jgi:chemotaxis protein CheC